MVDLATILFVGAHLDDIELGAGGLLIRSLEGGVRPQILIFSDCEDQPGNEGITQEFERSMDYLGIKEYDLLRLPNMRLPSHADQIRETLEKYKERGETDLVVTHSLETIHQDHSAVAQECQRVFRYVSVIGYEDFKSCPRFSPTLFVPLSEGQLEKKAKLISIYKTQFRRRYYRVENLRSLARMRGFQVGVPYAEAFDVARLIGMPLGLFTEPKSP